MHHLALVTGLIKEKFGQSLICIIYHGISHSMVLITGLDKETFGRRLVMIWLYFSHTRLVIVWSVTFVGHILGTNCRFLDRDWSYVIFWLGLISLVIAYSL